MNQADKQEMSNRIAKIIEDDGEYSVRSYSGRGMYGKSCIGITVDFSRDVVKVIDLIIRDFLLADQEDDSYQDFIYNYSQDSMGLGMIMYFPSFPPPDEMDEEEEDED